MDTRPSFLLNAGQCLPLANSIRQVIATILQSIKTEDLVYIFLPFPFFFLHLATATRKKLCKAGDRHIHLLLSYKYFRYAMLIADGKVVDYVQPKRHPLAPEGTRLILRSSSHGVV